MNKVKPNSNMYDFISHTWNPVQGRCSHNCSYCYMHDLRKRFPSLDHELRLNEKELNANLGSGNHIFVCSSTDLFAKDVPIEWINKVFHHCIGYPDNNYYFHTKNPDHICLLHNNLFDLIANKTVIFTVESNRYYPDKMGNIKGTMINDSLSDPQNRLFYTDLFDLLKNVNLQITIEPIMDFDLYTFTRLIINSNPSQVNIGADSRHKAPILPEPSKDKILSLIEQLESAGIKVHQKKNLARLL